MAIKLLIIGGVAGGATAAARARRLDEQADIILFERGEYISFANCGLPYYIGKVIKERDNLLVMSAESFRRRYKVDVRIFSEVIAIDRLKKHVTVKNVTTGERYQESYDKIILSPGAEPIRPDLEGISLENIYSIRNLEDTDLIKAHVEQRNPGTAVIVGGGFIGLEMAENLVNLGVDVTIIEMLDQVMSPLDYEMAAIVHKHLGEKNVNCILGDGVKSFSKDNGRLAVLTKSGEKVRCDMVILAIGVKPESRLAKEAGLEIGERGGIKVDTSMLTSDPHIYAVGDAVEVHDLITESSTIKALAGPANKQGRIAADNAMGRKSVFKGIIGTAIAKVFDLTVASTGANAKTLRQMNIPYIASYIHAGSHASYYPDSHSISIKLIFSPDNGKIIGAQIVGEKGVDKRIDVISTAIHGSMTVYDLEELELAYAPPYSSAKDPVNMAGFVAANILKGDMAKIDWDELGHYKDEVVFIDLRTEKELDDTGSIEGALHIPIDNLRDRLPDLDRDKDYVLFCAVGMRAYLGHRIFLQNGLRSMNLSGGFVTYSTSLSDKVRQTGIVK